MYRSKLPYTRYRLRPADDARVFEVTSPGDWHALCTAFPALEPDGRVVPDWSAVVQEWHAVHLTLGGMLTASQVKISEGRRWTEHNAWDAGQTLWLRNRFEEVERLPDLADDPPAREGIGHFWYWGPTWDAEPKPWRTRLFAFGPGDEDGA